MLNMPGMASPRPAMMNWIARAHRIRPSTRTTMAMPTSPRMRLIGPVQAKQTMVTTQAATMAISDEAVPAAPSFWASPALMMMAEMAPGPIKSFLIKASQGLWLETQGTGVHVTALCPGYTYTEFHDVNGSRDQVSAAYPKWMWMDADRVARIGWDAVEANRPRVTPGAANNVLAALGGLLPDALALKMVGGHAKRLDRL